ncbi:hypothetical protein Sste5346_000978 [Sporothrix stenoceras]|uniref:rRNA-processing protein FYV7 n=1 Tax=Sporothrix stenoceras TaxID=5173 RepID=A0ABR3ZPE6_9PEZI
MGKRPADEAGGASSSAAPHKAKRSRTGIRAALPTSDDAWRRKLERAKESNVIRAKTLQTYAKVKARALAEACEKDGKAEDNDEAAGMHPDRQARIDDAEAGGDDKEEETGEKRERRPRGAGSRPPKRPQSFFQKAQEEAAQRKAEAEARQAEFERRQAEREEAMAQRARNQKAMAKARRVDTRRGAGNGGGFKSSGGSDNQRRKLGRESGVLLVKVRRMMGK